jgi:enterochelin esterase-like enzyme
VLTRRAFLASSALVAVPGASAAEGHAEPAPPHVEPAKPPNTGGLTWAELTLERRRGENYRALVLHPERSATDRTYPGLLLFHGRGESRRPELGLHAWRGAYGLERAHARLARPPLALSRDERRYIEPEQLQRLDATLRDLPFSGLVYICPFTPNPHRARSPEALLDGYSDWIEHTLLPAVRASTPLAPARLGVDGCSMGGYVAAEVFARKPHLFQTFGVVQPAFGAFRVGAYAEALAKAQGGGSLRCIHLLTSTLDPYRRSVEALGRELGGRGARFDLDILPGPHDQRWLRATGTLAMLAWHERLLQRGALDGGRAALGCPAASR